MGLGAFSQEVQNLQLLLYGEGYDISSFDGIFDEELCLAVQQYQADNGLELADPNDCQLSVETIESLNNTIREGNYLGSGFAVGANGALEGTGVFLGTFGPGTVSFEVSEAEANSLREGDVVLMYTFLDEETILITSHESVITEIIKRRAFNDIFNVQ
jgi:peptidoglycan hydrolase-like protein with peptidoglycan-binding domain